MRPESSSMELYETRKLLGCTESCLYVCLWSPYLSKPERWFTLCRKPTQITDPNPNPIWLTPFFAPYRVLKNCTKKTEKKSSENHLVSIPTCDSAFVNSWSIIAYGCNIYKIGYKFTSGVLFMDCRSHTWHEAPDMGVTPKWPTVCVLDGKIYVKGYKDYYPSNWIECFDPKTNIWEHVPRPDAEIRGSPQIKRIVIEGKLYMFWDGNRCAVFKPKENKWDELVSMDAPFNWRPDSCCVIDNVLYRYRWFGELQWHDFEERSWSALKGLEGLPKLPKFYKGVRLVNYGGKIAVFWEKVVFGKKKIWCAEIVLERRNEHEIYGKVEWCGVVLTIPKKYPIFKLLVVND